MGNRNFKKQMWHRENNLSSTLKMMDSTLVKIAINTNCLHYKAVNACLKCSSNFGEIIYVYIKMRDKIWKTGC